MFLITPRLAGTGPPPAQHHAAHRAVQRRGRPGARAAGTGRAATGARGSAAAGRRRRAAPMRLDAPAVTAPRGYASARASVVLDLDAMPPRPSATPVAMPAGTQAAAPSGVVVRPSR